VTSWWTKLFASYGGLVLVTAVVVAAVVALRLERSLRADLVERLTDESALLSPLAEHAFRGELAGDVQAEFERLGSETGYRLTLIDPSGAVLADSHEQPERMEDHGKRTEVVEARASGTGTALRESRTVGYSMLYVARRLGAAAEPSGFVRVSVSLEDVDQRTAEARNSVLLGASVGLLAALVLGLVVAGRITAPILGMTAVARELSEGSYETRLHARGNDELAELGRTFDRLGLELSERIATMRRDDARLRAMLAGMAEGVVAIDDQDQVLFCNATARTALSLPANAEAGGVRLWEAARVAGLADLIETVRAERAPARGEFEVPGEDRVRVLRAHASPFAGGGARGLVIALQDVTDLRRLERVRSDFVANVSHELKTPLTSIQGFVDTLLSGALHDEENNERFLRRISANVERLTQLVADLLSLARIEEDGSAPARVPVGWRQVLEAVLPRHESDARAKSLDLSLTCPREVTVLGDEEALTQVADNLLGNAVRYTPDGGRVAVTVSEEAGRGVLVVEDSGVGIPRTDLERIFERFYRVDKARSLELGGTGLGLSIVRNLVQTLDGEVRVDSEVGKGSRFTVELPLAGSAAL
jgi:two-component system phosphate regulon sensor histidine kinase PhoR